MRTSKGNDYCNNLDEIDQVRMRLKQEPCPHCRASGYLIGHGFLRGYGEKGLQKEIRGRRFFCSNRNRRQGCGRTFSVLLADRLGGFIIPASTLWKFLKKVRDGLSRKAAWERLNTSFSLETAYRIWNRLCRAQVHIRTWLHPHRDPPPRSNTPEPLFQLIDHLISAFPQADCPLAAFQVHFQAPLLP